MRKPIFFLLICLCSNVLVAQAAQRKTNKSAPAINYAEEIDKCIKSYNLDEASDLIEKWETSLKKAKKEHPAELETLRTRILNTRNLLERVEDINLITSFQIDAKDFFRNYMLSPDAGELLASTELPEGYAAASPTVVYRPQNGKELFWAANGKNGTTQIVSCQILDDGTTTAPTPIGEEINDGSNTNYPFLLDDGFTIYYASDGESSLGGYDIYMTRRSPDGELLQPQNIGMPYNSPYNDYMMVIDEARNLGWWVSDREQVDGKLTVYVFQPSQTRINHSPDDESLADVALLTGRKGSGNLESYLEKDIPGTPTEAEFVMPLAGGKVYTSMSQFRNKGAAKSMESLLLAQDKISEMQTLLDSLRIRYAKGDKKVAQEIINLEKRIDKAMEDALVLSNKIIQAEK